MKIGDADLREAGMAAPSHLPGKEWRAPLRVCLAGEDLDWMGGRSVAVAADMRTAVRWARPDEDCHDDPLIRLAKRGLDRDFGPADLRVRVEESGPRAAGLASSTAALMCLLQVGIEARGLKALSADGLIERAYLLERIETDGGGMDQTAIALGGACLLRGNDAGVPHLESRVSWPPDWRFVIIDSGEKKHTPSHIAEIRRRLREGDPSLAKYRRIAESASGRVWAAILASDLRELGDALDGAHSAMRDQVGMSTAGLEHIREVALASGLPGVKLTGAGGGGCLVSVLTSAMAEAAQRTLKPELARVQPTAKVYVCAAAPAGICAREIH